MEQLSIVFFGSYRLCIYKTTFNKQYISEIMTVSFIGGEKQSKHLQRNPPPCHKYLTTFIT